MKRSFLLALVAFAVACVFMAATPAMAVHKGAGGVLTCGLCHTMHSSQGDDTSIGTSTGSLILLRGAVTSRANIHLLCLQCHSDRGINSDFDDSNSSTAPKVHLQDTGAAGAGLAVSASDPFDLKDIGAGGDFSATFSYDGSGIDLKDGDDADDLFTLGRGHSLGATVAVPGAASGDTATIDLSCTSCHDPHGVNGTTTTTVNQYRYLRVLAVGGGGGTALDDNPITLTDTSYVGEIGATFFGTNAEQVNHIWPVFDGTSQNVYKVVMDSTGTDSGISGWCSQCHDKWHEDVTGGNVSGDDWKRHPVANAFVDASTQSGAGVDIVRWAHYDERTDLSNAPYTNTTGTKLPAAQVATKGTSTTYYADDEGDAVFCLSCHFAHGGPWFDALRWNYTSSVSFGKQSGNAVASNQGCQQCHNR
jgi:hypothetical protein